ncbi:hypothetical protein [Candidatus Galacturonibacter soehngenii]|uniref:Rho termination factor N-terminal domain-containing protein n=1 Tax=Candidatus Galacturonatibacter soehngenii TaxID=2307010 RepID=A0A7V7QJT4_9FIRM|nr:hypothetical protein [Candidatus Galacturonibacter soehngenii]KAB1437566.1 hypothetical protein F7O84_08135 [Candidatus Galacturonibacter soehngenii]
MDTIRIKKENIEREVPEASKNRYLSDDWKEVAAASLSSMKLQELKALATEKGIEFDTNIKKEELLKLLEGAE